MPPSLVTNKNKCVLPAVKVGAVSDGNETDDGHEIVRSPVTSISIANEKARLEGILLNVKVELGEIVAC